MDRAALVKRNRAMAQAFHREPFKHRVRRAMLQGIGRFPFAPMPLPDHVTERILLIRPDHLGDVLLTTPAIHALKAARPRAEIHALVGPWSAGILANYPEIDVVLTLPFPGFSRDVKANPQSPYLLALRASRMLRRVGYHSAVVLRPDHWWGAMLAHLAGIRHIVGFDHVDVLPFLTNPIHERPDHTVEQNLKLVESWTGVVSHETARFAFPVNDADRSTINALLQDRNIQADAPILAIHPGSGTWVKRWDAAKWAQVADTLSDQLGVTVILTGSDHERSLVAEIAQQMEHHPIEMAGDTDIAGLATLFERCRVVLGPDSGPLHLAAAVGTPTVTLFGPAKVSEFGTWGSPSRHAVLTSDIGCLGCGILDWGNDDPANHPCVQDITVGRVLEAARRVVAEG